MNQSLVLSNLAKSYGKLSVFRDVSGVFAPGRLAVLVGPNGAGKTTLLRIVAGLQHADTGYIEGPAAAYYGGFHTLPIRSSADRFRRALGLPPDPVFGSKRMGSLSRGQLQMVGLAAALDLNRHTILLDEPWTALEPHAREELDGRLTDAARAGCIVVCSSHDLDEVARIADDIVLIGNGSVTWQRREDQPNGAFRRDAVMDLYRTLRR